MAWPGAEPGRCTTRYSRSVRYAVTVEPHNHHASPGAQMVSSTVDADDKDAALTTAEATHRRMYTGVGRLSLSVVRLRPRPK